MAPRLSVVVPVHNVEDYLGACLQSLAGQTMTDLEVVMIDDGSTDGSARIAREHAARDPRFRLVQQENAGLGAARNAGARHARGTHLAFVDSDDLVPVDAYEKMLAALEESGSDFVSGNVHRLRVNGRTEQSWMFKKAMRATRAATHVSRDWSLLADRIACNKVFRREFWDRHELAFPEGVLFEDTPVIVPAHFLADSVDVLHDTVYLWRDRDGSITNRRTTPRAVEERTAACTTASAFLAERAAAAEPGSEGHTKWAEGKRRYDSSVLVTDLRYFLDVLPDGDPAYHEAFLEHAGGYAATVDRSVLTGLPLHLRVKWQLVTERRIDEILALLAYEKGHPGAFRVRGLRRRRAEYPVVAGAPLPRDVTALKRSELPLVTRISQAEWRDGKLHLKGFAYRRNLPAGRLAGRVKFVWLRLGKRRLLPLKARTTASREATYASRQGLHRYDWAGFEAVVDPGKLLTSRRSAVWQAETAVLGGGALHRGPLRMAGGAIPAAVHYLDEHARVVPVLSRGRLQLKVERTLAQLTGHRQEGDEIVFEGSLLEPVTGMRLRVENWHSKEGVDVQLEVEGRTFTARVPLSVFAPAEDAEPREAEPWGAYLLRADDSRVPVGARDTLPSGRYALRPGRELYPTANASGNLELRDQTVRPIAETLTWDDGGELTIGGSFPALDTGPVDLVLRHSGYGEEITLPVQQDDGRFKAALAPAAVAGLAGELPLAEGRWYLYFRAAGGLGEALPMHVAPGQHQALPLVRTLGGRAFSLERRAHDRLLIASGSALPEADRGAVRQSELRAHYQELRASPRRDAVLYSSFDGRQHSDSPRAVHEELAGRDLGLEHLWVVRDQQAVVPPSARPVVLWSAEWYEALARCRAIVTNTQLPQWFERAEGQTVVQTWHGTPLKRIGRDVTGSVSADPAYIATLPGRAAQWSALVSPNRVSTPILRSAFGYEGEVLEYGYPRSDLLHAADRAKVAAAVRERLGIPDDAKVVLYAPTWRENQPKTGGRYGLDLQLNLTAAERALGEDHVLLVRRHYLVGGTVPGSRFVRDVTRYPDVAELLLISDVLVTDYSSLMFDFAQTGRPMLFHTHDLDHYRDTLRGFYFDFEAKAPGPLIAGQEELLDALRDPEAATAGHAAAYAAFRETYCDLDDGRAAARVADYVQHGFAQNGLAQNGGRP
ncbi:bifunctional glycosyltransferase family 2 protein/CDP-glycerol:glycerophosphate glycerophosphotransferase [Streptomyces sp. LHD-70]|uniref:bifunctional glycosyltransferase/CDP-glycerol:glycerophosphate glycerophosphotransferase n=1 Tax=Streptomyces sp. LHD-70 TaxID=3072140 RepID=UPI002810794E|nr:bifunctional glycosyltransferase family 2 protein/CDP-glycerol:glycerophosphate glycerophosphotransferase [Streptomyces sp. LHD-70]MDQ8705804.1 bifunctional glycosyltransferase family 2 protein/CDP-glycerol:glycerophosphate glycerophosphotransferase [Streptomyces sp. LHD-70]